jgi:lipopolysaccharide export system protein LptC
MKRTLSVLLLLIASCTLAFAGGSSEKTGAASGATGYKDTIIFGQGADVTSFDPHIGKETPAVAVTNQSMTRWSMSIRLPEKSYRRSQRAGNSCRIPNIGSISARD